MSTQAQDTAVRAEVVVDAPLERAFSVFTEGFGSFKPPEHNMLAVEIAETVFEPRVGGGHTSSPADSVSASPSRAPEAST
jgi:hypothetical protein